MQWYLPDVKAPDAWKKSLGRDVVIGLVDSGVDMYHEDLADNILPGGRDFGDSDNDPSDEFGHGTMVCGVIAAIQNNDIGISGCAPEAAILPIKVSMESSDSFTEATVAEGIIYAADYGVSIINLSLGWDDDKPHQVVKEAIDYAIERGVVLVAAAGNNHGPVWFPANYDGVISVSGTDQESRNDNYAFGPELDLVAPGGGIDGSDFIFTTTLNSSYGYTRGTSFSAAIVSGVAALLLSQYPDLTREQVKDYLILGVDDLDPPGKDDNYGYGKVNALKTLNFLGCIPETSISCTKSDLCTGFPCTTCTATTTCDGTVMEGNYSWYIEGTTVGAGDANIELCPEDLYAGEHTLTVTDTVNGEVSDSEIITVDGPTCCTVSVRKESYPKSHFLSLFAIIEITTTNIYPKQETLVTFVCEAPGPFPSIVPFIKLINSDSGIITQFALTVPALLTGNFSEESETCTVSVGECNNTGELQLDFLRLGPIPLNE
jgi:hypothetical protein